MALAILVYIFCPHFRGSFSWLQIGSNTNITTFVPLEALEAGVILAFDRSDTMQVFTCPHFRGSFSWLSIGKNINLAAFVPLEVLEAGVIPWEATTKLPTLQFVPIPRGVLFKSS